MQHPVLWWRDLCPAVWAGGGGWAGGRRRAASRLGRQILISLNILFLNCSRFLFASSWKQIVLCSWNSKCQNNTSLKTYEKKVMLNFWNHDLVNEGFLTVFVNFCLWPPHVTKWCFVCRAQSVGKKPTFFQKSWLVSAENPDALRIVMQEKNMHLLMNLKLAFWVNEGWIYSKWCKWPSSDLFSLSSQLHRL